MEEGKIRCIRCNGRKNMYKVRGIYSHTNSGGILVVCPMCNGEGAIKKLETVLNEINQHKESAHVEEKRSKKSRSKSET